MLLDSDKIKLKEDGTLEGFDLECLKKTGGRINFERREGLMAKWGKVDYRQLVILRDRLEKLQEADLKKFQEDMVKELAGSLLRKAVKRTPVDSGKLREGWFIGGTHYHNGYFEVEVYNNTEYASYVESGHRAADYKGWVPGRFMLLISAKELEADTDKIVEKKLMKLLEEAFHGK